MEGGSGSAAVPSSLIALRVGDPVVEALKTAGPGPLVVVRLVPRVRSILPRGSSAPRLIHPREGMQSVEQTVRARLAELVGPRHPAPSLLVRLGDPVEQVALLVAETRAARVIAPRSLGRRLASALSVPVVGTEDGVEIRTPDPLGEIMGFLHRALGRPTEEKLAALRDMDLFRGLASHELRRLASLLDVVELGPGQVLTREGRLNDALWILLEGTAERSIGRREMGHLGPRSLIGVPSMVYGRPAIATVTAREPVRAMVAGRAQLQAIAAIEPVALRLKAAAADRLCDYLLVEEVAPVALSVARPMAHVEA